MGDQGAAILDHQRVQHTVAAVGSGISRKGEHRLNCVSVQASVSKHIYIYYVCLTFTIKKIKIIKMNYLLYTVLLFWFMTLDRAHN